MNGVTTNPGGGDPGGCEIGGIRYVTWLISLKPHGVVCGWAAKPTLSGRKTVAGVWDLTVIQPGALIRRERVKKIRGEIAAEKKHGLGGDGGPFWDVVHVGCKSRIWSSPGREGF